MNKTNFEKRMNRIERRLSPVRLKRKRTKTENMIISLFHDLRKEIAKHKTIRPDIVIGINNERRKF